MAKFFISYSQSNKPIVQSLAGDIEALGHDVWFDKELTGGQSWWDEILQRLRACDVFLFALSPASLDSTACKREYRYAAALGKRILPVLIADGVSASLLPPEFSGIQYVDYRSPNRETALALARAILNLPPSPPLPDPLPEPPEVPVSYLNELKDMVDSSGILQFDEQAALAFRLKEQLKDPAAHDDVRSLMRRFRARPDLLARVAEDIDLALGPEEKAQQEGAPAWKPGQRPTHGTEAARELFEERSAPSDAPRSGGRSARSNGQRTDRRRGAERRDRRERSGETSTPSTGRWLRIAGGIVCGFFALSFLAYFAEWGDVFALIVGVGFAAGAYKLIRS
jgi:hypothetical protein